MAPIRTRHTHYTPHITLPVYFAARPGALRIDTPPPVLSHAEQLTREEDRRLQRHDPGPARLRELKESLDKINYSGEFIPTFDAERKIWVAWNRLVL